MFADAIGPKTANEAAPIIKTRKVLFGIFVMPAIKAVILPQPFRLPGKIRKQFVIND